MSDEPDWQRIQKALAIEAQYGYTDLMGQQYRFGEFLCLSFGKPPTHASSKDCQHWRELAFEFAKYQDCPSNIQEKVIKERIEKLAKDD